MNIDIRARVLCADGLAGWCSRIIVDPTALRVTHLVVQESEGPRLGPLEPLDHLIHTGRLVPPEQPVHTERLVPLEQVIHADSDRIQLACTRQDLSLMDELVEHTYRQVKVWDYHDAGAAPFLDAPVPEKIAEVPIVEEHVPLHELAIDGKTRVEATDGQVGQVDQLTVERESGRIVWLVMRDRLPWSQKGVAIPAAQIERLERQAVYVKLDKHDIGALPVVPVGK